MNLTIRNIPDEVINKIRTLSQVERRSLNSEILVVLEHGLNEKLGHFFNIKSNMTKELQVNIWRGLAAKWEDDRSSQEIINDIYQHRTMGRHIDL
jgi:plasmid stability protein